MIEFNKMYESSELSFYSLIIKRWSLLQMSNLKLFLKMHLDLIKHYETNEQFSCVDETQASKDKYWPITTATS